MLAAWLVAMAPLFAQQPDVPEFLPHEELAARHKLGKPPFDTKWIVNRYGVLTQLPNAAAGGSTKRGQPFLTQGAARINGQDLATEQLGSLVGHWNRAAMWLAPLLRHPGDLLGSTNANYHFTKLARDPSTESLRMFLVQPSDTTDAALLRREVLDRELTIRLLMQRKARSARAEIQALAKRTDDPFLRQTARQALASFGIGQPPSGVALADLTIAAPKNADLWFFLDTTKLKPRPEIATATRKAHTEWIWSMLLRATRGLHDVQMAGAQFLVDIPDEMPFELARAWGRARVDQCLLAVQPSGDSVKIAWAAASGCFETTVLADYLSKRRVTHTNKDGVIRTDTWWPNYQVEIAANHLFVCHKDSKNAPTGDWPAVVAAAKKGNAALAFEVPTGSRLKGMAWLPVMGSPIATVAVHPFSMSIKSRSDEATAKRACNRYAKRVLVHVDKQLPIAAASWSDAFRNAQITNQDKAGVRIDVRGQELDLWQLWPLLQR